MSSKKMEDMEGEKEIEEEDRALEQDLKIKLKHPPLRNMMAVEDLSTP